MTSRPNESVRELRRILGQTQAEWAVMIGAAKDTGASWETGSNKVSAGMARRLAFATGADAESLRTGRGVPTVTLPVTGARGYTAENFARYRGTTRGRRKWSGWKI